MIEKGVSIEKDFNLKLVGLEGSKVVYNNVPIVEVTQEYKNLPDVNKMEALIFAIQIFTQELKDINNKHLFPKEVI